MHSANEMQYQNQPHATPIETIEMQMLIRNAVNNINHWLAGWSWSAPLCCRVLSPRYVSSRFTFNSLLHSLYSLLPFAVFASAATDADKEMKNDKMICEEDGWSGAAATAVTMTSIVSSDAIALVCIYFTLSFSRSLSISHSRSREVRRSANCLIV